ARSSWRRPRRPAPPCAWPSWRGGARLRLGPAGWSCASFHDERQPGDDQNHSVRVGGRALVEEPLPITEAPGKRIVGHDAEADLVRDKGDGADAMLQSLL